MAQRQCNVCGNKDGPAIFSNDPWCSDNCRKLLVGEWTESTYTIVSGKVLNPDTGFYDVSLHKAPRLREKKKWAKDKGGSIVALTTKQM